MQRRPARASPRATSRPASPRKNSVWGSRGRSRIRWERPASTSTGNRRSGARTEAEMRDYGCTNAPYRRTSQEPPLEQNGRSRRYAEDQKKDGELFGHRVTRPRDADPHIGAGDDEPQRDVGDRRHEHRAGIVRGKKLSQQQSRTEQ